MQTKAEAIARPAKKFVFPKLADRYPAIARKSRWESSRISGGVSGIGSLMIEFEVNGEKFQSYCGANLAQKYGIDPVNKGTRTHTAFQDNWTGATAGSYKQEVSLRKEDVLLLLAQIFERRDGETLNPYRFRKEMKPVIISYCRLAGTSLNDFLSEIYPASANPWIGDCREAAIERKVEWEEERQKVIGVFYAS
jgi:hypothetical protein